MSAPLLVEIEDEIGIKTQRLQLAKRNGLQPST
jgi:hypothetical protein